MFSNLTGKYDKLNAHLTIFPGAGGDDAKDWADMLFSMYLKYAQKRNWKVIETGDRSLEIKGEYAYGNLKKEMGVHRLVRISPFSAKKLRHTSFALVEIIPVFEAVELKNLNIPPEDFRVEFTRSSGPGGQNVNKRETAVRVVHIPTGLACESQAERGQGQNREKAMNLLKAKLFHMMQASQMKEISELRTKVKPEWGNQIRSYVLHPYKQVVDHRTKLKVHNPEEVLNGELDKFIDAELDFPMQENNPI